MEAACGYINSSSGTRIYIVRGLPPFKLQFSSLKHAYLLRNKSLSCYAEASMRNDEGNPDGISIRRRPTTGPPLHYVGPFEFRLENEGNTPRNILEEIVWNKDREVTEKKERIRLEDLKRDLHSAPPVRDFINTLKVHEAETCLPALIAEVKKASPSKGVIQPEFDPIKIAQAYERGGAACISVLTDSKYFQGSFDDLKAIRDAGIKCPLLCKEFIIDAWQLYYARFHGADAVLLIAGILPDQDLRYMTKICKLLQMSALVEVHSALELDRVLKIDGIRLIGINNRDLENSTVDINKMVQLLDKNRRKTILEKNILVVGESGLFTKNDIALVQRAGANAVLVGESIVKHDDPAASIAELFGKNIAIEPRTNAELSQTLGENV
eukprot:TRINITY_DN4355_c0_g1_i1.p1 TRINITY_DN4355_c0_g1~~TRINITY_DN4355_c0_g1_i1.p1  ORF type:complete len:382 (+),score=73.99 TRINITY_DN4355_c0_g1_i1:91-1236(+)